MIFRVGQKIVCVAVPRSLNRSEPPLVLYLSKEAKQDVPAKTEGAPDGSRDTAGDGAQPSAEAGTSGEVPSDTAEGDSDVAVQKLRADVPAKKRGSYKKTAEQISN